MEQYFTLTQGLRGGIFSTVKINGDKETYVDLVKVKFKVTHLGYHH